MMREMDEVEEEQKVVKQEIAKQQTYCTLRV